MYSIKDSFKSKLTWYLAVCVILSAVIAGGVGYILFYAATSYVERISDEQTINQTWQVRYFEDLQDYVTRNNITADNISDLKKWTDENTYVYLSIYQNQQIIFNSDYSYVESMTIAYDTEPGKASEEELYSAQDNNEEQKETADAGNVQDELTGNDEIAAGDDISGGAGRKIEQEQEAVEELEIDESEYLYKLMLADGTTARADIFCYDYWKYYYYVWGLAVVIGVFLFVIILTRLIQRKIRYINGMAKELQILEGGNLEYPITIKGEDELANLARGIEQMRLSIINNMKKEQQILQGNKELVTSISHDLRTPLTTLTGYLEMLNMGNVTDEEKRKHYLELSLAKSREIKQLSDDLFEYFLIYAEDEKRIEVEPASANMLAEDLMFNQMLGLEEEGYTIEGINHISPEAGNCMINSKYMQRVLNNIISNLGKYADKEAPIEVSANVEQQFMVLRVRNKISSDFEPHESTKIGLITCERIMKLHHGEFQKYVSEGDFIVKIVIPME